MKVTLFDYTGAGTEDKDYAVNILLFTKETRLKMSPEGMEGIDLLPWEEKERRLKEMANTIPSSWEFVDYTFMIEGVSRAFTHQFVRTRAASFAQQTMRVLEMEQWGYYAGPTIDESALRTRTYGIAMDEIARTYSALIKDGAAIEDARGILPTNILTNICAKMDMRCFVDLCRKRSGPRIQGEYRDVLEAMKEAVRAVHPWIDIFIDRTQDQAAKELDDFISLLGTDSKTETKLHKLVDLMRTQS